MKRTVIAILALMAAAISAGAADGIVSAQWEKSIKARKDSIWVTKNYVQDDSKTARMTFVGKKAVFCYDKKRNAAVSNVANGDYFLFTMPVGQLPKGTTVNIDLMIGVTKGGPSKWVCDILDGKKWVSADDTFETGSGKKYNETTYVHSFTLSKKVSGELQLRCRVLDAGEDFKALTYFCAFPRTGAYLSVCTVPLKDTKKALLLGNSYTFYNASFLALLEIAQSQGHGLDITANLKGGRTFGQHLRDLKLSQDAVAKGGYDLALLQNQSISASEYALDPEKKKATIEDAAALSSAVRKYSPSCRIILERTWAGPKDNWRGYDSAERCDSLLEEGSIKIAGAMNAGISPLGNAFALGRAAGLSLYARDGHHPSRVGSYLKSCVNYLVIWGEPFTGNVPDYGLDPSIAAKCREIAGQAYKLSATMRAAQPTSASQGRDL